MVWELLDSQFFYLRKCQQTTENKPDPACPALYNQQAKDGFYIFICEEEKGAGHQKNNYDIKIT